MVLVFLAWETSGRSTREFSLDQAKEPGPAGLSSFPRLPSEGCLPSVEPSHCQRSFVDRFLFSWKIALWVES